MGSRPVRITRLVRAVTLMVLRGIVLALVSRMTSMNVVRRRVEFPGVAHLSCVLCKVVNLCPMARVSCL